MNKRGQFGIVIFFAMTIALLIMSPIVLKIIRSSISGVSDALNSTLPSASEQMNNVQTTAENFWDFIGLMFFGINVLLLLISAFFIDTHPAFLLVYVITCFFLILIGSNMIQVVDSVWGVSQFSEETGLYLTSMDFIRTHFGTIILGIIILSGIVMYAKFRYFSQ